MTEEKPDRGEKPEDPQWLIDNIAEASKNTRKIYLLYLGFLAYCALTVISTTDRTLVLNEPAHLPIVNVGVPLEGFFIFAPIMAIMTFIYLQLYLKNLNDLKSELRDKYKDIEKSRIYPWIVNIIDNSKMSTKDYITKYGVAGYTQRIFVYFVMWWTLPAVLIIFALTYVKKHDIVMSYYLTSLSFLSILLILAFWSKYEKAPFLNFVREVNFRMLLILLLLIFEFFLMAFLIPWSMEGGKYDFLKPWICVDLDYQKLVNEPEKDYKGLYWADFRGVHLEGASMWSAVLKRADMRYSNLKRSNLWNANLEEARLDSAELQGVKIGHANLQNASISRSSLKLAECYRAKLQNADLSYSILHGTDLTFAMLQGADLDSADLQGARLWKANLQGAILTRAENLKLWQLTGAKTLYNAQLDSALFEQVKAEYPHLLEPPEEEEEKPTP